MIKRKAWLAMLAMATVILGGCDSYSLLDQFALHGGLRITPQSSTLRPGESSPLYLEGGTAPYSLYSVNGGLYDDSTAFDLGTLDDVGPAYSYTAGDSIGPVTIRLGDSLGFSTSATITVVPHAPTLVNADGFYGGPSEIQITWNYPYADKIAGFTILRSKSGAAFTTLVGAESLPKSQTSFIDTGASPSTMNIYRVYAFAGQHLSGYGESGSIGNPP